MLRATRGLQSAAERLIADSNAQNIKVGGGRQKLPKMRPPQLATNTPTIFLLSSIRQQPNVFDKNRARRLFWWVALATHAAKWPTAAGFGAEHFVSCLLAPVFPRRVERRGRLQIEEHALDEMRAHRAKRRQPAVGAHLLGVDG